MAKYEHHMQADNTYKVYETKNHRYISKEQFEYMQYLREFGNADIKVNAYVPPVEPTLEELKNNKRYSIKSAYESADRSPCNTGVMVNGVELTIQYSSSDRELWQKGVVGAAMEYVEKGEVSPSPEDLVWLSNGILSPGLHNLVQDKTTTVKDYYNKFHVITIGQMHTAAIKQNLKMKEDLQKKWQLEAAIEMVQTKEQLEAINW